MFITLGLRGLWITFATGFVLGAIAGGSIRAHGAELPYCNPSTIATGCSMANEPNLVYVNGGAAVFFTIQHYYRQNGGYPDTRYHAPVTPAAPTPPMEHNARVPICSDANSGYRKGHSEFFVAPGGCQQRDTEGHWDYLSPHPLAHKAE